MRIYSTTPPENNLALLKQSTNILELVDTRLYFVVFCLVNIGIAFLYRDLLITDSMYYAAYSERLSYERIQQILDTRQKYEWLIFVFTPLSYLIQFSLVAVCLLIGAVFYEYKIGFGKIFKVVMWAELVFILPKIIKFIRFYFFVEDYSLADLGKFYPYSLLALFAEGSLSSWLQYPVYLLNIFELMYWFSLAYGFHLILQKNMNEMFAYIASTYGVGLFFWVIVITYLQIMAS
jgi:hypothetical protein